MDVKRSQCSCWYNYLLLALDWLQYSLCTYNSRFLLSLEKILRSDTPNRIIFFLAVDCDFQRPRVAIVNVTQLFGVVHKNRYNKAREKRRKLKNHWKKKKHEGDVEEDFWFWDLKRWLRIRKKRCVTTLRSCPAVTCWSEIVRPNRAIPTSRSNSQERTSILPKPFWNGEQGVLCFRYAFCFL